MGKVNAEELKDGGLLNNRSCTDAPMIVFFALFLIGWIIILVVAIDKGDPKRILLPENFRGQLCGDGDLIDYPYLFVPRPSRMSYGVCAPRCPAMMDYVCNNDLEDRIDNTSVQVRNSFYSHTSEEYSRGATLGLKCMFNCTDEERDAYERYLGLLLKLTENKCFLVFYSSGSTMNRCLPFQDSRDNATIAELAGESRDVLSAFGDRFGATAFFQRGFSEVRYSWAVILICSLTACVISAIWIFLLRWILAPIVYLCVILIFALLVAIGYLGMLMADDLENVQLPGDTATDNQVKIWRAVQWGFWMLAGIYFFVAVWLMNRIRIAIAIMKEASRAFLDNPGMVIIPPIALVVLLGFTAFFIVTTVYIQTIGEIEVTDFQAAAIDTFGERAVNQTLAAARLAQNTTSAALQRLNATSNETADNNSTQWETDDIVKALHAYNFFGFLWVANFCIMFGFFIMAMVTSAWYFSATSVEIDEYERGAKDAEGNRMGRLKSTPLGTMLKSFRHALISHLGTILWGSLLIAIIQFIRAVFLYIQEEFLEQWKENPAMKFILYCINCCLACIERVIKIISKNAFIVTCIKNTWFCSSAREAVSLLVSNALRVGTLATMSTAACFVIKLFIVGCNMIVAYFLLRIEALTEDKEIESGLFPLVGIFILSFIIASLFINVYESCVDTILLAFFIDEADCEGLFLPPSLQSLVDNFTHVEEARREYEKQLKMAMNKTSSDPVPSDEKGTKDPA